MTKVFTRFAMVLFALSCLLISSSVAQQTVSGVVTSDEAEPLIGVNILVVGTSVGAVTDFDGRYEISVQSTDTLSFSYIGYETQYVVVGSQSQIDIVMGAASSTLDEIVVVGYGTMKKSDVSGSIISMRDEALTDVKSGNVLESLQGRVAGVEISRENGRAGADVDVLVRGQRSLAANNGPLILVDGVPYGSTIDIDQSDIESVEFLKDAASTAIYGSRGANGVILITTKRGSADRTRINFNAYYGIGEAFQKVPVYDRDGYIQASIDANKDIFDWEEEPPLFNVFPGDELAGYENGTETDWQDLVTHTGAQQNYLLGFEGGSEKIQYSTTLGYFNEKGVTKRDEFQRFTAKINLDAKLHERVTVGTSTFVTYRYRDGRGPRFTDAVLLSPIVPAYDSLGNYIYQPNFANPRKSALAQLLDEQEDRTNRIFSTVYGGVEILKGLSYKTNFNVDLSNQRLGYMYPQKAPNEGFTVSGVENDYFMGYLWNNILAYNTTFGEKHSLYATLVHEVQYDRREVYYADGQQQQFDRSLWYNLSTNQSPTTASMLTETSLVSFLGRVNYTFDNRFIVSFSGRYDGASQLSDGNKWEFFPAGSLAWRMIQEDFMRDQSVVSDLKLRASYGVTGNAAIAPYSTAAALNVDPYYYQYGYPGQENPAFSFRPEALASIDLQWERTAQWNFGVDFGFFNNRLYGSFDYFIANTDRLLLPDQLPPTTGFDNIFVNAGKTKSNGIELFLHSLNIDGAFQWSTDLTFFTVNEEIVELASGLTEDEGNGWFVGYPVNVHYDFEKTGIWQFGEEDEPTFTGPGEIKVKDVNNDGVINFDDRVILGTPLPDWSGSLVNTFSFKGVDLSVNIFAKFGNMLNAGAYSYDPRMYDNMIAVDYWTPENPTNEYPRYDVARAELPFEQTLRYRDGSYVKVRNITLGYSFSDNLMNKAPLSELRIYATAQNPFILHTNLFDGLDPERGGSINWPLARIWIFGINTSF